MILARACLSFRFLSILADSGVYAPVGDVHKEVEED